MAPSTREEALDMLDSCQVLSYLDKAALFDFLLEEDDSSVIYLASAPAPRLSRTLRGYLESKRDVSQSTGAGQSAQSSDHASLNNPASVDERCSNLASGRSGSQEPTSLHKRARSDSNTDATMSCPGTTPGFSPATCPAHEVSEETSSKRCRHEDRAPAVTPGLSAQEGSGELGLQAGSAQAHTPHGAALNRALREYEAENARIHQEKAAQTRAVFGYATQRLTQAHGTMGDLVQGYMEGIKWANQLVARLNTYARTCVDQMEAAQKVERRIVATRARMQQVEVTIMENWSESFEKDHAAAHELVGELKGIMGD